MKQPNTDKQKAKAQKSDNLESGVAENKQQTATEKPSQDKSAAEKKSVSNNAESPSSAKKAARERSQPAKQRLAWVAIALTLGLAAAIYWHGHQQVQLWQQQNQALVGQIDALKASLSKQANQNLSALNQAKENTDILIAQQQQSIEALQRAIQEQQGRHPNDWLIAEAHYLVNLAGKKLWLEDDPATAAQLLFAADARIAELNDPSVTPIRQKLANDIASLKAIPSIDHTGIVMQLTSLQREVAKLPLPEHVVVSEAEAQLANPSASVKDWKSNLALSFKRFGKEIISYQRIDQDQAPLLSPKQRFYLQENLKQQFAIASQATLEQNQALYEDSLSTAKSWIVDFFAAQTPQAKAMIASIESLQQQKVSADYPQQLQAQVAIDDLVRQRLDASVMPTQPAAITAPAKIVPAQKPSEQPNTSVAPEQQNQKPSTTTEEPSA